MSETTPEVTAKPRRPLRMALPFILFAALAGLFLVALFSGDPSRLPSALIGKPAPEFQLPPMEGLLANGKPVPGFSSQQLKEGEVAVINVWASWCVPCRVEHPFLMKLAEDKALRIYGINYKDNASAARRFLGHLGNPFAAVGVDNNGRAALDWGVYGVPETFIVNGKGQIVHKHVGPIGEAALKDTIIPIIAKARADKS